MGISGTYKKHEGMLTKLKRNMREHKEILIAPLKLPQAFRVSEFCRNGFATRHLARNVGLRPKFCGTDGEATLHGGHAILAKLERLPSIASCKSNLLRQLPVHQGFDRMSHKRRRRLLTSRGGSGENVKLQRASSNAYSSPSLSERTQRGSIKPVD
jgi:hypothetical protein